MRKQLFNPAIIQGYLIPENLKPFSELLALQSTRAGGVSEGVYASLNLGSNTGDDPGRISENMLRLCHATGINPKQMASSIQVHGTEILVAEKPGKYHGYDAFITNRENLFLCIFTADCYPILLFDPRHKVSAAVHAGWKGSAGRIVMKTVAAMQESFGSTPAECVAFIGTGISGDVYEVDYEIAELFPESCRPPSRCPEREGKKQLLDLRKVNLLQLLEAGIPAINIEYSRFCSYRDSSLFYSYRRDQGETGRMVSLIGTRTKS